ncbi:LysR family transcriptional regulator [Altererythrobacter sp. B11]|uniref:LysR family transcriptional regulator n=1 Tax=Altererythrobacter sp. B11 TaxID=2060312 RepID=UPI000DC6F6B3|nr:LysR family transcriptional regulator [Altererythrobacter sp. B11]BBC73382.1 LysR family transcriptional regulator [Altererythrobacter sp. B11]
MARTGDDLTLGQLRTFVCVARAGSFIKAADSLGISQPAVSEQINLLEERLGHMLFYRRRGTTPELTPYGREALEKADYIIEAVNSLMKNPETSVSKPVVVNISIGPRLHDSYLKPLLPRLYREHPQIQINSQPLIPFCDVGKALQTGAVDLAAYSISTTPRGWVKELVPVCSAPAVLVAPPGMGRELAPGTKALAECQFLFPGDRNVISSWVEQVFAELGIVPKLAPIFFQHADVVLQLVADGQGVSVLLHETCIDSIKAGKVEIVECQLSPLQRIIGRSPHAPSEARIVEEYLSQALSAGCEEPTRNMVR